MKMGLGVISSHGAGGLVAWWPGLLVGQHYKVASSVRCHKSVSLDVARMQNKKQTTLPGSPHYYARTNVDWLVQCQDTGF